MTIAHASRLALLVTILGVSSAWGQDVDRTLEARLERYLDRAEALGFGGQVLVGKDGRVVFHEAYGMRDWRTGDPYTRDTPTGIASVTKMLTAAAVLRLVDDGLLSTGDSLGALLPDVPAEHAGITVHELLTHTSGLPGGYLDPAPDASLAAAAARALAVHRDSTRVGTWRYSSEGFLLLAAVIERVADRPWDAFLRDRILNPGGMGHTMTRRNRPPGSARAYVGLRDQTRGNADWANAGAGDVFSTASDLFRWGETMRSQSLLSADAWSLVESGQVEITDGYRAGYGTFVRAAGATPAAVEHGGDDLDGYGAFLGVFRDPDITLVMTSNARDYLGRWWRRALGDALEHIVFDGADPEFVPLRPVTSAARRELVGTYRVGQGAFHVIDTGGPLLFAAEGQDALDAIAGHAEPEVDAANRRIEAVLDSLLASRPDAAFGLLVSSDTRPVLTGWWSGYQDEWGALRSARILGSEREDDAVVTSVALQLEQGMQVVQFVVDTDGALRSLNPDRVAEFPLVLPVAREGDGPLHAEDPFTGRTVRFRVEGDRLQLVDVAASAIRTTGLRGWRPDR